MAAKQVTYLQCFDLLLRTVVNNVRALQDKGDTKHEGSPARRAPSMEQTEGSRAPHSSRQVRDCASLNKYEE